MPRRYPTGQRGASSRLDRHQSISYAVMTDTIERLKTALADRYTIQEEIGAGGMATVYPAHDVKQDRRVGGKYTS